MVVLAALVNLTTGCFPAQPIEGDPVPQTDVQVILTEDAAWRISHQAGQPVGAVSGRVIQASGDSLVLAVRWREIAGGSSGRPGPDVVRLHRSEIESIGRRQFSLQQTLIMAGVAFVLVGVVVGALMTASAGTGDDQDPTDDDTPGQR